MLRLYLRAKGIAETAEDFAGNIDRFCFVRFDEVDEPGPPPMQADLVWVWPLAGVIGAIAWLARRRLRSAIATAGLSVPALVGAALVFERFEARYTDSGMRLEGRWARLWAQVYPPLVWWLYDGFAEALELQPDDPSRLHHQGHQARRRLRSPDRCGLSGEGRDRRANGVRGPWVSTGWEHLDSSAVTRRSSESRVAGDERHREDLCEHHERRVVGRHVVS
jgi:hypothetical protein